MTGVRGHRVVKGEDGYSCQCGFYLHRNRTAARDLMAAHRRDVRQRQDECEVCEAPAKYANPPLCAKHYQRWRANGRYDLPPPGPCLVLDCDEPVKAYGYCVKHYRRVQATGSPDSGKWTHDHSDRCSVPGCGGEHRSMGLCEKHYRRESKNGHPIWKTLDKGRVHGDRPWTPTTVRDPSRLLPRSQREDH